MPLTESAKKYYFGHAEPIQERDWGGPNGQLLYEGYAAPTTGTTTAGWFIIKHYFDANGNDTNTLNASGCIWSMRTIYFP